MAGTSMYASYLSETTELDIKSRRIRSACCLVCAGGYARLMGQLTYLRAYNRRL